MLKIPLKVENYQVMGIILKSLKLALEVANDIASAN